MSGPSILEVAQRRGARLKPIGSEHVGPCPKCGGRDRFSINTAKGVFNCRQCDGRGDAIALARHVTGMSFADALAFVGDARTLGAAPSPAFERTADLLAAFQASRDLTPPLWPAEAALVDATPVVLDPAQYARAVALGLAGRLGEMQFDAVIFDRGGRFRFARDCADQRGAEVAFVFAVPDRLDVPSDVIAWHPETGRVATLFGQIGLLGLDVLSQPWRRPPALYESLLDWWPADELGVFVVDDRLAAIDLAGEEIVAGSREAALSLQARLARHSRRPPKIFVQPQGRAVA